MWSARIILILLLFCSRVAAFDVLNISTITDRNGLSQNTIRCMMQDSHGFMWMGTINGLNRYNGKDFVVIQPGIATSQSHRIVEFAVLPKINMAIFGYVLSQILFSAMI